MVRIVRQNALEGSCSDVIASDVELLGFPSNITSTGYNERVICLVPL